MSLITLGTVAIDNIKTPTGMHQNLLGGSASHFSMSARLFTKVHLVSVVGEDFPQKYMQFLRKKGVDLTSVLEREGKTFSWTGEYLKGDFNHAITLSTELGVLLNYYPQVSFDHHHLPYVFLANFDPDSQANFLHLMKNPKFVGMDTMNLWIANKVKSVKKLMKKVDLFVANDGEAKALSGETNLIQAAKALRKMGPGIIVIKKGENGVLVYTDRYMFAYPSFPVDKVLDPTGAGDTFAGGLMGYIAKENKVTESVMRKAAIYATTLASFNVEAFGMAKTAPLTLSKVHVRLNQFKKFIAS